MRDRVRRFIEAGEGDAAALALDLWAHQVAHNQEYAAFCGDAQPQHWTEIPAVPVTLFRDLSLTCFPPAKATVTFETSGTTAGQTGRHRLRDTEIYDLGARRHAEATVGPLPRRGVFMVRPGASSSLSHMCHLLSPEGRDHWDPGSGLDLSGAWADLRAATEPIFVVCTGFAAAELVAGGPQPCRLPEGSVWMITGGFKGRDVQVDPGALWGRVQASFPGATFVGEYGMTELSSQLWAPSPIAAFRPPPWLLVHTVDPWTGAPAPEGLLRFVDLANHDTVLAIETEDLGRVDAQGDVHLLGRLSTAPLRGCSLPMEAALG